MKKIFSMMMLCAAVVFASCSKDEPKADSESTTITWATGNLVADGPNGAKIGEPTDGGLYFQFGSLVGWSTTGSPTIAVKPANYAGMITWNENWAGDPATENAATGTGDPCKYYLKGTWRLPTKEEYKALFKNTTTNWVGTAGWSWTAVPASATHTDGLTFPASGFRSYSDGSLSVVGTGGYCWSASPGGDNNGYSLLFGSSTVVPNFSNLWAYGYTVRCVQEK